MSKRNYGESMNDWERRQEEQNWENRCQKAITNGDREKAMLLIEEGVLNDYNSNIILELEKL